MIALQFEIGFKIIIGALLNVIPVDEQEKIWRNIEWPKKL
jgi:hypothetical protein